VHAKYDEARFEKPFCLKMRRIPFYAESRIMPSSAWGEVWLSEVTCRKDSEYGHMPFSEGGLIVRHNFDGLLLIPTQERRRRK